MLYQQEGNIVSQGNNGGNDKEVWGEYCGG